MLIEGGLAEDAPLERDASEGVPVVADPKEGVPIEGLTGDCSGAGGISTLRAKTLSKYASTSLVCFRGRYVGSSFPLGSLAICNLQDIQQFLIGDSVVFEGFALWIEIVQELARRARLVDRLVRANGVQDRHIVLL